MIFLCSGEGPADIGLPSDVDNDLRRNYGAIGGLFLHEAELCRGDDGEYDEYEIVRKEKLTKPANTGRPFRLHGKGTGVFFSQAYCLAQLAIDRCSKDGVETVAVLFRDSDTTHSKGTRVAKRESIYDGYKAAKFQNGIAMLPEPTSEAWVLRLLNYAKYRRMLQTTTDSKRLKDMQAVELEAQGMQGKEMYRKIRNGELSSENLHNDESFQDFRQRLCEVLFELRNGKCFDCGERRK